MAEFYETLAPLAAMELERLREAPEAELARLEIESVAAEAEAEIVVLFRDPARPGCRFGWRWSWAEDPQPAEADFAASLLVVNFEEDVISERYGLPDECVGDGITWL